MTDKVQQVAGHDLVYKNWRMVKVKKDANQLYEGWMRGDFKTHYLIEQYDMLIIKRPDSTEIFAKDFRELVKGLCE